MEHNVMSKIVIVISIFTIIFLLVDRKIINSSIIPANKFIENKTHLTQVPKPHKLKTMTIVPVVDPNSKKEISPAAGELNEDELQDFTISMKKLKKVNSFDQRDFFPNGEIIYPKGDYYESIERLENQKQLDDELAD